MPEQKHIPLSLVGELLVKPALRALGIETEVELEKVGSGSSVGNGDIASVEVPGVLLDGGCAGLPARERIDGAGGAVKLIPAMADPVVLERVLKALRKL